MNSINIIGNITKDIELKYTKSGKAVTTVSIAVNEGYGDNQKTHFIEIQAWEKQAENLAKYCGKGSKIAVSGKLIQQTWEYEGKKQSKVLVQAFNTIFLDNKKAGQAVINEEKVEETDPFADFGEEHNSGIEQQELELTDEDLPF